MNQKHPKTFVKGAVLFREGDPSDAMYIVKEGKIAIRRANDSFLVFIGHDEFFGEMGFFDNLPRSASAIAETDSQVWVIKKADFESQINCLPTWCKKFFKILSQRIRETNERIKYEVYDSDLNRFLQFVDLLLSKYGKQDGEGYSLAIKTITQQACQILGLNKQVLTLILTELDTLDNIKVTKELLIIKNLKLFHQYSRYYFLGNGLKETIGAVAKNSKLAPSTIRFMAAVNKAVNDGSIPRIGSDYIFNVNYLDRYLPVYLNITKDDIEEALLNNLIIQKNEQDYVVNIAAMEAIYFFQSIDTWIQFLTSEEFYQIVKYLNSLAENKTMEIEEFNNYFYSVYKRLLTNDENHFLERIELYKKSEKDTKITPNIQTLNYLNEYLSLQKELFSK